MKQIHLADVAQLRYALYRFLSASLLYPEEARLEHLSEAGEILEAHRTALQHFAFYGPWRRWADCLGRYCRKPQELQASYTTLCQTIPLQASRYLDPEGPGQGRIMLKLERKYREAGLMLSTRHSLPPDHLAVELEFMAFLCQHESEAWAGDDPASLPLPVEHVFLRQHLRRWVPLLTWRVREEAAANPYRIAVEAIEAFIHHDADWLALVSSATREWRGKASA
ncbi:molecular chaperone [Thermoflexus sp.]|uniref:TorD/DmsD family molecular chaperone n=1 Tax=Thermoflexus sp. TaxID=1969742 RepID=UPI0035E43C95